MSRTPTTALITGAGSGLGQEVARQLARSGWAIAAVDANEDSLQAFADELHRRDVPCATANADVADSSALRIQIER